MLYAICYMVIIKANFRKLSDPSSMENQLQHDLGCKVMDELYNGKNMMMKAWITSKERCHVKDIKEKL